MKHIRLILGLLGVILFVCHSQAAGIDESPLSLLKAETFNKLTFQQQMSVVYGVRGALADIERSQNGEMKFGVLEEAFKGSPLWELLLPQADARNNDADMCLKNGVFQAKPNPATLCKDMSFPKGNCSGVNVLCEATLYGPGICAANLDGCEASMKRPGADQNLMNYMKDPEKRKDFVRKADVISNRCTQNAEQICQTMVARLSYTYKEIKAGMLVIPKADIPVAYAPVAGGLVPAPVAQVQGPVSAPQNLLPANFNDPVVTTDPNLAQAAAPPAARPPAPPAGDQGHKDARDVIKAESGDFGACNQWDLAAQVFPDDHGSDHPMLMTFEEAQQMVCEHRPFTQKQSDDIEQNLVKKLQSVARRNGAGASCNSRTGDVAEKCKAIFQLMNNFKVCKAEMAKHPVDNAWAHALGSQPGVTVDGPTGGDGIAAVTVHFLASYQYTDSIRSMYLQPGSTASKPIHPEAGVSPVVNGKFLSPMLAIWKVPICDVYRKGASHSSPGVSAPSHAAPSRSIGTDRAPQSVEQAPESTDSGSSWVVPSLPQGAPGGGRPTSGQGSQ